MRARRVTLMIQGLRGNGQRRRLPAAVAVALGLLACAVVVAATGPAGDGAELLRRMRATYAGMASYSDSGTVTTEYRAGGSPLITERHSFETYYQAPRNLYFEFRKDPKVASERYVIWGAGEAFHSWWSATQTHSVYPPGSGATAFALGVQPTVGSTIRIPSLLFAKAGLHSVLTDFSVDGPAATEQLAGRACYRISGEERLAYGTGAVTGVRPLSVWVDAETLLVRRIVEDTPAGRGGGDVDRITVVLEPTANSSWPASRFRFAMPGGQQ